MHRLLVGQSLSGKSLLAQILVRQLKQHKHKTAVFDPLYDSRWDCDYSTASIQDFSSYLEENRDVFFFVDESGIAFDEGRNLEYAWLATLSRHWGHVGCFLAQRVIQVPKTMRDQCKRLYLFNNSKDDCRILAEEWNKPVLNHGNTLATCEFFGVSRMEHCDRYRIENHSRIVVCNGSVNPVGDRPKRVRNRHSANNRGALGTEKGS